MAILFMESVLDQAWIIMVSIYGFDTRRTLDVFAPSGTGTDMI